VAHALEAKNLADMRLEMFDGEVFWAWRAAVSGRANLRFVVRRHGGFPIWRICGNLTYRVENIQRDRGMGEETAEFDGPVGRLRLRPTLSSDEPFQFDLFCANRIDVMRLSAAPAQMIENLLAMQYRARKLSYRETFPSARWSIVESAGAPIGELILNDEADAVYIVDIGLAPERQGRGIGAALVGYLMKEAQARGGVRAVAAIGNAPSRKMFARLGFSETACNDAANIELRWRGRGSAHDRCNCD
jgi:ribosomal protein S18 acetylase RimI-like enzyme